jgi:serine/threonine protein kinase/lipopolysaccharide biosynthesis regulator YciM
MTIKCPKCDSENTDTARFCSNCATSLQPSEDIPVQTKTIEAPKEELTTGSTFAERYQIIEELGRGGMGRVYKAQDKEIKEKIALKLIKPEISSDKKTIERFQNELKLARKISHRNVCRMHDLGKSEGNYFITMEYVDGENLKGMIRMMGQLTSGKAISIAKQVCEGLSEAHRIGVVHRDLKPSNIMIDKEGNAKIMDFGIARSLTGKGITGVGVMIGTPEYMSPEQVESKEIDQRSDIYSLGVILYEMVTGQVPFEGDTPYSIGVKHKSELPRNPIEINPQISDDLNRMILKCLEKEKDKRYQSAGELRSELENIEKGMPTTDRVIPERKPLTSREITVTLGFKKLLIPIVALLVIILATITIWQLPKKDVIPLTPTGKPLLAIMYFDNNTGDERLDNWRKAISDLLITDLNQSKYLSVLSGDRMFSILKQLNLLEARSFSTEDLENVLSRGKATHILQGNYIKAGETLRINSMLHEAGTGKLIASDSVEGLGEEGILSMIDELTKHIKKNLEITPQEIAQDVDKEIGEITTSSPEAYKYYSEGRIRHMNGEYKLSISFMERALDLDPEFVMAYRSLAMSYSNLSNISERNKYLQKAFDLRDKVSDRERLLIEAQYIQHIRKKYHEAIKTFEKYLEAYPEDIVWNTSLGNLYESGGEWGKALEYFKVPWEQGDKSFLVLVSLANSYQYNGMYDKAREILGEYLDDIFEDFRVYRQQALNYLCEEEYDLALAEIDKAIRLSPNDTSNIWIKGHIYHFQEEFTKAEEEFNKLPESDQAGAIKNRAFYLMNLTRGKIKKPRSLAEQAYIPVSIPNRLDIGRFFGTGLKYIEEKNFKKAEENARELKAVAEREMKFKKIRFSDYLMGMIELGNNNFEKAIEYFENAITMMPYQSDTTIEQAFMISPLAFAYYKSGQLEKSIEMYKSIISLTIGRLFNGEIYAKSFYMLGKIHEQQGDTTKAIENYEKFLDMWKDADPGIAEVEDARKRLAGLKNLP